ncbi:MAG: hypothetical protein AAFR67_05470 [Chloroflexota bacterium]
MALINQFLQAQQRFQNLLLSKAGVVGVGVGYKNSDTGESDELSLVALVEQKKPLAAIREEDIVPQEVEGAKTDVVEVGVIRAQTARDRFRPIIPAGISVAHPMVTAGTLGCFVYDDAGNMYILSNNHVLSNSNDALIGDRILQPGPADGGENPKDTIALLHRYAQISYTDDNVVGDPNPVIGKEEPEPDPTPNPDPTPIPDRPTTPTNPGSGGDGCAAFIISFADTLAKMNDPEASVQVVKASSVPTKFDPIDPTPIQAQAAIPQNGLDAAIARVLTTDAFNFNTDIVKIGKVTGTRPPTLGMRVRKYGRTTEYTEGTVTLINATIDVAYSTLIGRRTARFTGQVMTTGMSAGGDSGSLIVAGDSQDAVGLLFAGSGATTIFTPIERVLSKLKVKINPNA